MSEEDVLDWEDSADDAAGKITVSRPRFEPALATAEIRPAEYNPRYLSDEAFARLKSSIDRFGFVKPIIVNGNGTIVAGHQRTKAAAALGVTEVPALVLGVHASGTDEIRFNLLHNSIEESGAVVLVPPARGRTGYHWVPADDVQITDPGDGGLRLKATYKLMIRFGEWGSAVAHPVTGRLVLNAEYAVCCARLGLPLLVYYPTARDADPLAQALSGDYGVYDAAQVAETPWVQNVVQPHRLRAGNFEETKGGANAKSAVWRLLALPRFTEGKRVLDFGAGNADYAKRLRAQGHDVDWYEPFYMDRRPGGGLDVRGSIGQLTRVAERVEKAGLYDLVVLDSVLNATSDDHYHDWVLRTVAALLAPDGVLCLGTRALEAETQRMSTKRSATPGSSMAFLGPDGRGIQLRNGAIYTMKYHTAASLPLAMRRYFDVVQYVKKASATHLAIATRPSAQNRGDLVRALVEEFDPPYPGQEEGQRYYRHDRHERVVRAILAANEAAGRVLEDGTSSAELPSPVGGTLSTRG